MAVRPLFIPTPNGSSLVERRDVEFTWSPGLSKAQKQRSIASMHKAAEKIGYRDVLEISSKSTVELGIELSAFNLSFKSKKNHRCFTVESVFQGSKVFEKGGPFIDLYEAPSREAKRDQRLRDSGNLIGFRFFREEWPLAPLTAFYDWVYIKSLVQNTRLASEIMVYQAFSDIEFNPAKSINCQAHAAALFCSLSYKGVLSDALASKEGFVSTVSNARGVEKAKRPVHPALAI